MNFDWTYDEVVLATDLVARNNFKGLRAHQAAVADLSQLLRTALIHPLDGREANFRSPSSVQRKTFDIATQHPNYGGTPTRGGRFDGQALAAFLAAPSRMSAVAAAIRSTILNGDVVTIPSETIELEEISAEEGRLLVAKHFRRERNPKLRRAKIEEVRAGGKSIACEVCTFDFAVRYGPLGLDYIEVHHILPLHASGPTRTRLQDLALLCSNCHRMIHRSKPWLTPDELSARLLAL